MLSRAESRVLFERVLRGIVVVALAVLLWQSLRKETNSASRSVSARGAALSGSFGEWSTSAKLSSIHVQLDEVPSQVERAWLGALAASGSTLTWSGDIASTMIDAQPIPSPATGTSVTIAAPNEVPVVIHDEVGVIDTVSAQSNGASLALGSVTGRLTASGRGSVASTVLSESILLRKVLVIGNAGWESKFVVAALEEDGWNVDALIRVTLGVEVKQGSLASINTSDYSAVVALDAAASAYANRIIDFARMGGGVVLAPPAASLDAMEPIRAGAVGRTTLDGRAIQAGASVSLATLSFAPITSLRSDAVQLENRAGNVAIASRRIGLGRALQVGYEDTWRWRMVGERGIRDHRIWWTGLVSSVAYAPRAALVPTASATDEAPMAGLFASMGPGTSVAAFANKSGRQSDWLVWLFALLALGLISEAPSRRLRGAP